jgi:hypothetical protein
MNGEIKSEKVLEKNREPQQERAEKAKGLEKLENETPLRQNEQHGQEYRRLKQQANEEEQRPQSAAATAEILSIIDSGTERMKGSIVAGLQLTAPHQDTQHALL